MLNRSAEGPIQNLVRPGATAGCKIRAGLRAAMLLIFVAVAFGFIAGGAAASDEELAHQPKSEYRARRQKLMEQIKDGIVVLIGAREDEFGEVGRFRQKNDFMYLTGVETPSAYLIL